MRIVAVACVALVVAVVLAAQVPSEQQKPTFRTAINYVRVDVYPSADGKPVADLAKEDFEVLEDGVAQKVDAFEHIVARPRDLAEAPIEPRSVDESNRMAADLRNRLFVLFLDTYHVTTSTTSHNGRVRFAGDTRTAKPAEKKPLGPGAIDKAIMNFLTRTIAPNDLFAAMTPEMDARSVTFTRRPDNIEELLSTVWGRRYAWDDLDPEEERWARCYPPEETNGCYGGILEGMVLRRREMNTFSRLADLVTRLGELREGRKAALVVSEGWALYTPDRTLARPVPEVPNPGCQYKVMAGGQQVMVGADGKLRLGQDPRQTLNTADWQQCESARMSLANINNNQVYKDLLDRANRANVSFYPVDPRGLAVFDTPIDAANPGSLDRRADPVRRPTATEDQRQLDGRLETLRTLATATDGRAMVNSNDLTASLQKISDDLSDYYLLGYYSTNAKADGKFRKISVRVKRPGVAVRARRGYLAVTEAEVAARMHAEKMADPVTSIREAALEAMDAVRADRPLHVAAGHAWDTKGQPVIWVAGDLDLVRGRQAPWRGGADATITIALPGAKPLATEQAAMPTSTPRFLVRVASPLAESEYVVRVAARAKDSVATDTSEVVRVLVPDSPGAAAAFAVQAMLFRRGPFTGAGYQPTGDPRFRKAERLRADVPMAPGVESLSARLLDRNGNALPIPVAVSARDENGLRVASAEVTLAPLGQGDYLIEISGTRAGKPETTFVAFRVVPQ